MGGKISLRLISDVYFPFLERQSIINRSLLMGLFTVYCSVLVLAYPHTAFKTPMLGLLWSGFIVYLCLQWVIYLQLVKKGFSVTRVAASQVLNAAYIILLTLVEIKAQAILPFSPWIFMVMVWNNVIRYSLKTGLIVLVVALSAIALLAAIVPKLWFFAIWFAGGILLSFLWPLKYYYLVVEKVFTDQLTQTYNRQLLYNMLKTKKLKMFRYLMIIDVDDFKHINDTYGHLVGDLVLKALARRIKSLLGEQGLVVRVGGDEFLVLVATDEARIQQLYQKIKNELSSMEIEIDGVKFRVSVSISQPVPIGELEDDFWEAYKQSDKLIYLLKNSKKSLHTEHSPTHNAIISEHFQTTDNL